jgi:nitrogen regulatory protein P-II 1
MKRIEAVITPWSLDAFKEAAPQLGITAFDLVEVYRSGCTTTDRQKRLYRGQEYAADLLPRLKLEFVLFDDDVTATLHQLLELVHPESIAVFKLDETLWPAKARLTSSPSLGHTTNRPTEAATSQIVGFIPRRGCKNSDDSSPVALRNATDNGNDGKAR